MFLQHWFRKQIEPVLEEEKKAVGVALHVANEFHLTRNMVAMLLQESLLGEPSIASSSLSSLS